ncbi:MAG: MarC family protein [Fidelibacterota bacterium]
MDSFFQMIILMIMLLNPFLLVIYLVEIIKTITLKEFAGILGMAGMISSIVFIAFAITGEIIFQSFIHAKFESFQIFGGIVFLLISINFMFNGNAAISSLRGDSQDKVGAIAMPILIGPGSLNVSVLAGKNLGVLKASLAIIIAVTFTIGVLILLKIIHDIVLPKNARVIDRYVSVMGKVTSLYLGTVAIQMLMNGIKDWWGL